MIQPPNGYEFRVITLPRRGVLCNGCAFNPPPSSAERSECPRGQGDAPELLCIDYAIENKVYRDHDVILVRAAPGQEPTESTPLPFPRGRGMIARVRSK